jgi:two-component system phosphate regulon response regulator PhoB
VSASVLIVEDEAPLQKLLAYNLRAAGFDTTAAHDGEEALLLIAEQAPDLILLDWMLPQLSGLELCRRLRRALNAGGEADVLRTVRAEGYSLDHKLAATVPD